MWTSNIINVNQKTSETNPSTCWNLLTKSITCLQVLKMSDWQVTAGGVKGMLKAFPR